MRRLTLKELALHLQSPAVLSRKEENDLQQDPRRGAQLLLDAYRRRRQREKAEIKRLQRMLAREHYHRERGAGYVAGLDEAGRGPLAGPVVAAAVIMPPGLVITGLKDSKQLSAGQRDDLYRHIRRTALGMGVGIGPVALIDRINIFNALMVAMRDAIRRLPVTPDLVLVDGYPVRGLQLPQEAIKGGDAVCHCIAAASVVAKVIRDRIMVALHQRWPEYGFEQHKGYATAAHREALRHYGICPCHRRTFNREGTPEG